MNSFEKIYFKGQFRDYQQRVLDNADKYLKLNQNYEGVDALLITGGKG